MRSPKYSFPVLLCCLTLQGVDSHARNPPHRPFMLHPREFPPMTIIRDCVLQVARPPPYPQVMVEVRQSRSLLIVKNTYCRPAKLSRKTQKCKELALQRCHGRAIFKQKSCQSTGPVGGAARADKNKQCSAEGGTATQRLKAPDRRSTPRSGQLASQRQALTLTSNEKHARQPCFDRAVPPNGAGPVVMSDACSRGLPVARRLKLQHT